MEEPTHAIDLLRIIYRWWKPASMFFAGVVLAALIYCLATPNEYTARATLIPGNIPSEMSSMQSMAGSFFNRLGFQNMFRGASIDPADVFASTLRSRFIARNVVQKLELIEALGVSEEDPDRALEKAVDELLKRSSVDVSDMLLVSVEVTHENPKLAADIANTFLDELDRANQQFSLSSARKGREFVEDRLSATEEALLTAQQSFTEFQLQHGAIALDEQSKATVEAVARLEGEIIGLEAKRDALGATHTSSYSKFRDLDLTINALRGKVRGLTGGAVSGEAGGRDSDSAEGLVPEEGVFIPLGEVPSIAAEYARLLLDVKMQGAVLEILVQQHEQLKIEEAKDVPTIQVLDRAYPPIKKSGPFRTVIVIVAAFVGLVGSIGLVGLLNYIEAEFDVEKRKELMRMGKDIARGLSSALPGRRGRAQDG